MLDKSNWDGVLLEWCTVEMACCWNSVLLE